MLICHLCTNPCDVFAEHFSYAIFIQLCGAGADTGFEKGGVKQWREMFGGGTECARLRTRDFLKIAN